MWDSWIAYGTWALVLATAVLAGVALWQILEIRSENKKQRTLTACSMYDYDPVIFAARHELRSALEASNLTGSAQHRGYIITILNYLDGIAIGLDRHLYDEKIARDHVRTIVFENCELYFKDEYFPKDPPPIWRDYLQLTLLMERWELPRGDERAFSIPGPMRDWIKQRRSDPSARRK